MLHAVVHLSPLGVVEAREIADEVAGDTPNALEPYGVGREGQFHVFAVKQDIQRAGLDIGVLFAHVVYVRRHLGNGHSVGGIACSYHAVSSFRA